MEGNSRGQKRKYSAEGNSGGQKRKYSHAAGLPKGAVLLVMVLAAVMILAIAAFRVAADSKKEGGAKKGAVTATPAPTQAAPAAKGREITAIVERVDTETKTIQAYCVEDREVLWLSYTSATDIADKYDKAIVAGQLQAGDILSVEYDEASGTALRAAIAKDTWEYSFQTGLTVGEDRQMLTVGGRNFMYSEALHVFSDGAEAQLSDILESDSVTLRGIGSEAYVILLEWGHGYLTLTEAQDYIGGSILVNNRYMSQITEDMRLTLTEGTYRITVENDDLTATVEARVVRDQTTVVDLTEYARVPDPVGQITFKIQPAGAVLWINDENTYYGEPVELAYGVYTIRVESGGYVSYEGILRVDSAAAERSIVLTETPADAEEPDTEEGGSGDEGGAAPDDEESGDGGAGENTSSSGGDSDNTSESPAGGDASYETDDEHHIIIYSDDEVEIYLDGDYMGVTEDGMAEFEKFIGTFELELVRGDETKSYIIQVDDDGEDFIFRRYFE